MTTLQAQIAGGKATSIILRKQALDRYYSNPILCRQCKKVIPVKEHEKVFEVRRRKFCDKSCAASYNRNRQGTSKLPKSIKCALCGTAVEIHKYFRKYCDSCKHIRDKSVIIDDLTKGELFSRRKNWQSARSSIRNRACVLYKRSDRPQKCFLCGYPKHVNVAHRKAVSEFPNETKVKVINDLDNLVALCPTHHWEHDNDELSKSDLEKIRAGFTMT